MVGTVWPDLRVAVRLLLRSPGFSLTAILTLAAGMSATTLVFTAINACCCARYRSTRPIES